ncbi:MAG: hypothetical protein ACOX4L_06580, partial [Bacillota bacterium]
KPNNLFGRINILEHGSNTLRRQRAKGSKPHGRGKRAIEHGSELDRYPFRGERRRCVAHAKFVNEYLCFQTRKILIFEKNHVL